MGLLRKTLLIGTAGLAPVKANSKKERTAKAAEKQVRLQQQALRATRAPAPPPQPSAVAPGPPALDSPGRMARAARRAAREDARSAMKPGAEVSAELGRLADLHGRGALTDEEFAAAKAKVLET